MCTVIVVIQMEEEVSPRGARICQQISRTQRNTTSPASVPPHFLKIMHTIGFRCCPAIYPRYDRVLERRVPCLKRISLFWLVKTIVIFGNYMSRVLCNMAATVECGVKLNPAENSMSLKKVLSAASPLSLRIVAECPVTKARACDLILPHSAVSTPVFMPVGTQGTMKGITVDQLEGLGCQICLGNTYHLGMRPVGDHMIWQKRI